MSVTAFTGCSKESSKESKKAESSQSGKNTFTYSDDDSETPTSTTITGTVSDVDGDEVTLSIGGGMGGNPPDGEAPGGGDKPDGNPPENGGETPNGDSSGDKTSDGEKTDGNPPEKPSGDDSDAGPMGGESKEAVLTIGDESIITVVDDDNNETQGSLDDLTKGTSVSITFDETGEITSIKVGNVSNGGPGGQGGPGEQSGGVDSYEAVTEYSEDTSASDETYESDGTDENAIHVTDGAKVSLDNVTVNRTSDDSTGGDNSSFYGVGAALLTTDGTTYIKNSQITTDSAGGAGIFSYGDGKTYVADTKIKTSKDTSGGIHVAGGGTLYAWDLDVETDGESAAAIRSDRGGGTMVVDGGTYTSNGVGSPAVYCTADIAVNNAKLTANGSEAICMEGLNTIHLFDCDITGNMSDLKTNDTTWDIIVYQSMSGDSEVGNSTMQIVGGSLTSKNGGLIYTTNTECDILMSDVDITYADDSEFFLQCTGNTNERGWGNAGANGSQCKFTAENQEMQGKVIWDSISELNFYMKDGSTLTGSFVDDETYAGDGGGGYCNVYVSKDSKWVVTGDSTVTSLYSEGTIVDEDGKTVTILGEDGTKYVTGDSQYTITVEKYDTSADFTNASKSSSWSDYETAKPEELK